MKLKYKSLKGTTWCTPEDIAWDTIDGANYDDDLKDLFDQFVQDENICTLIWTATSNKMSNKQQGKPIRYINQKIRYINQKVLSV